MVFPICECAVIPVARTLIRKGIPVSTAVMFMLAVPIINPAAPAATYFAFARTPEIMTSKGDYTIVDGMAAYQREDGEQNH